MPTHIAGYRLRLDVKMALAKSALGRLTKPRKGEHCYVKITGETLEYMPEAKPKGIYNFAERFPIKDCAVVEMSKIQFESRKERNAFGMYLNRMGFVCTARNVFTKSSK